MYTFGPDRALRDAARRHGGTPDDQMPEPSDSPEYRRQEALRHAAEERRRFLAGELRHLADAFTCRCPPVCDELDDGSGRPVHADDCTCRCDIA